MGGPGRLQVGELRHQLPRLNIGLGRKHVKTSPGSIRGRAEATYEAVLRQRDANSLRNLETNRPQLQHDPIRPPTRTTRYTRCA